MLYISFGLRTENSKDLLVEKALHLAMESAHAEVAVLLINAGARRDEVCLLASAFLELVLNCICRPM